VTEASHPLVQEAAPNELRDPLVRIEMKRAGVWLGMIAALALIVLLIQPLMLIFAGLVFAAMLDGGVRLLGRVLPIGRGWRLLIVMLLTVVFIVGVFVMTGVQIAQQFNQLQETLTFQASRVAGWVSQTGLMPGRSDLTGLVQQAMGSVGRLTSAVGTVFGALGSMFMILVIGLFIAMEPRLYERGLQWMVPTANRREFAITIERMGKTMRRLLAGRLLGMLFEGVLTWIVLEIGGVPMALILGILTGLLAFIPNIGAFISGLLMVAVGFSAGPDTGIWAIGTYFAVQTFDGYVLLPMVARRTVDMPPALTLGSQIIASSLLGILGLALADPLVAMIKVALERGSEREEEIENEGVPPAPA
jgi:predicted PurR-regulated permease PerM